MIIWLEMGQGPQLLAWHLCFLNEALGTGISNWSSWITSPGIKLSSFEQAVVGINCVIILSFLHSKVPYEWGLSERREPQISQLLLPETESATGSLGLGWGWECGLLLLSWYHSTRFGAKEEAACAPGFICP